MNLYVQSLILAHYVEPSVGMRLPGSAEKTGGQFTFIPVGLADFDASSCEQMDINSLTASKQVVPRERAGEIAQTAQPIRLTP
jgi:hypothetical protein